MIRVATDADSAALRSLIARFRDHLELSRPSDQEIAAALPELLESPHVEFCLAPAADGTPAGYTQTRFFHSLWETGTEAHLEDVFVLPKARCRGLGHALIDFAVARARERGARLIGLQTNERNEVALGLYSRAGFDFHTEAIWPGGREVRLVRKLEEPA